MKEHFKYTLDGAIVTQTINDFPGDPSRDIWSRRKNLTGVTLRAAYELWEPFSMPGNKGSDSESY